MALQDILPWIEQDPTILRSLTPAQQAAYTNKILIVGGKPERVLAAAGDPSVAEIYKIFATATSGQCRYVLGPTSDSKLEE